MKPTACSLHSAIQGRIRNLSPNTLTSSRAMGRSRLEMGYPRQQYRWQQKQCVIVLADELSEFEPVIKHAEGSRLRDHTSSSVNDSDMSEISYSVPSSKTSTLGVTDDVQSGAESSLLVLAKL